MRILYLNPIGALGGAERSLLEIFAAIRAVEPAWELHLIAGSDGPLLEESARLGVKCDMHPLPGEWLMLDDSNSGAGEWGSAFAILNRAVRAGVGGRRYAERLRAGVRALSPDLIHSNGLKFHLLTRMMGEPRAPVVWHIRDFMGSRRLMRFALRWASRAATLAIANSEATAADARTVLRGVPVRTVLNGIDLEHFSPGPRCGEILDDLAGIPSAEPETLRVGLPATYARWKGQDVFLNAAAIAHNSAPNLRFRFYIVGGPIYITRGSQFSLDELRGIASRLGIADRVGLIPFQSKLADVYRALDIVVNASTQPEPFGRTIAEGMACGRPVIAANAGGTNELFSDGEDALGFVPCDAAALAAAIIRLAGDAGLRATMGHCARLTAEKKFAVERMIGELTALYKEVLK